MIISDRGKKKITCRLGLLRSHAALYSNLGWNKSPTCPSFNRTQPAAAVACPAVRWQEGDDDEDEVLQGVHASHASDGRLSTKASVSLSNSVFSLVNGARTTECLGV